VVTRGVRRVTAGTGDNPEQPVYWAR